jgi:hypothetical protein
VSVGRSGAWGVRRGAAEVAGASQFARKARALARPTPHALRPTPPYGATPSLTPTSPAGAAVNMTRQGAFSTT